MPTYPATLPDPLSGSYQETAPETTIRTRMDAGPDKVRQRFTAAPTKIKFALLLTKSEVSTLDTFFVTTVKGGSLEFDYTHPRTAASVKARFTGTPSYTSVDPNNYRSNIELEILP